jgi:HAAS
MQLIDLYIQEVGRHLPEKVRADIQQEIRSLIEDTLEDQSRQQGRAPDDDMLVAVLKKLGPPDKMAASYLPPRYLIGPILYPTFITTLQIVLPIVVILTALSLGVSIGQAPQTPAGVGEMIGKVIGGVFDAFFHAVGIVVIVFAILQYTAPQLETRLRSKEWDPRQMKPGPDPKRVKYADLILEAVFTLIAIAVFNFYPQIIGFSTLRDGQWISTSVLTQVFFQYLPFLTVLWAFQAGFDVALVARGHWDTATRWAAVVLYTASIILLSWMVSGPAIVAISPQALISLGWNIPDPQTVITLSQGLEIGVRIAMGIAIVATLVKVGQNLYYLLLRERLQVAGLSR